MPLYVLLDLNIKTSDPKIALKTIITLSRGQVNLFIPHSQEVGWCQGCGTKSPPDTTSIEYGKKFRLWSRPPSSFSCGPYAESSEYIFDAADLTVSYRF